MKKLRILKNNKGQSVVEFALIVPILLLLVFGIVEFGYAFYNKSVMEHAARSTLRMASVGKDISQVAQNAQNSIEPLLGEVTASTSEGGGDTTIILSPSSGNSMTVNITPSYSSSLKTGDSMSISIFYTLNYITPVGKLFGDSVNLKAVYYTTVEAPPK